MSFPAKARLLFPTRELHHWFTSAPLAVDWSPRKQPCKSSSVTTARGAWCRVSTLTTSRTSCTPPRKEHPASPASRRRALIYKTRRVRRFILNLCISDGRPERVKQLSGLLVVQVLIWIWGPRGGKQESDMRAWTHNKHGVMKEAAWLKGALEAGLIKAHWASQRGSNWSSLREVALADITVCYVRGGGGMPAIRFLEVPL